MTTKRRSRFYYQQFPNTENERYCGYCEMYKPLSEFGLQNNHQSRECKPCQTIRARDSMYKQLYGLKKGDYDRLFEKQEGVCAICACPPTTEILRVDHDHSTGQVRGLLCRQCNIALGMFQDSEDVIYAALKYILRSSGADLYEPDSSENK